MMMVKKEHYNLTLKQQIELYDEPHCFEGLVYEVNGVLHLFCQVGYGDFRLIDLESGNRHFDVPKWKFKKETGAEFMSRFSASVGYEAQCVGTFLDAAKLIVKEG